MDPPYPALPDPFDHWFAERGWQPHDHQLALLALAEAGRHALLVAPTGGGKTLAGFLPSLIELAARPRDGLHTLYISPLKALSVDIRRNLEVPLAEMRLPIRAETRTGDTPPARRKRQIDRPPQLLMTTPESLALMLARAEAAELFAGLSTIIIDELHALVDTKRGDQLALALTRLQALTPRLRRVGLSATVADPPALQRWLAPDALADQVALVGGAPAPEPVIEILTTKQRLPWSGHMAVHALGEVYQALKSAGTAIVFVNTRAQAEIVFQALWRLNEDHLAIALHHGSLDVGQRRKVEAAMAAGRLRAVVATASLDLGLDWGAVDLVVQIGAPKGAARLLQRIGRANHRFDTPSRALLVPANRFEVLECQAALEAIRAGTLDGTPPRPGGLDVLAQHIAGRACAGPFRADDLYREIRRAAPYADLSRPRFDAVLDFVATGGYALKAYERYARLIQTEDGRWQIASKRVAQLWRMNSGTIVEEEMLSVRLKGGRKLGRIEEWFVQGLAPGDSFIFAGELLSFIAVRELTVIVRRGGSGEPKVPAYAGGRLPLSTHLAERVRAMLADPAGWAEFPDAVRDWLKMQEARSRLPGPDHLLIESFPRGGSARRPRQFTLAYCFAGRNAHQTLGLLATRRMERMGLQPLGFVATDYVIAIWSLKPVADVAALFAPDLLGDDLEEWMAESSILKRTFRQVAIIAGLIERNLPGAEKSGRQLTVSADLIYDVLRAHQPDHILLQATRADAAHGLTDIHRLNDLLTRYQGRILHRKLDLVSPLAVPVLLEIGKEQVFGEARDALIEAELASLLDEAGITNMPDTGHAAKTAHIPAKDLFDQPVRE